tara:strand:+ start:132 stop:497 length:366 start_codon:yes stop_codon:yes gene_type:complete
MKKYFVFKGTISGWRYFIRLFLQQFLIFFFGLGLYLMAVTAYKRASAFFEDKVLRIFFSLSIVVSTILSSIFGFILGYENYDYSIFFEDTFSTILTLCYLFLNGLHFYLWFANSKIKDHSG